MILEGALVEILQEFVGHRSSWDVPLFWGSGSLGIPDTTKRLVGGSYAHVFPHHIVEPSPSGGSHVV